MNRALFAVISTFTLLCAACGGGAPVTTPAAGASSAAASAPTAAVTKSFSYRIAHTSANTSILEIDSQDYIKKVADASGGKITGKSFPNGQLGKQQEMVEQVQLGSLEMVVTSSEFVSVVPEFGVFDLPFAFRDRADVKKAVEGPLGEELKKAAAARGLVVLGFWENGFRHITNNKRPIRTPDDLKGLKMRTPPNPDRVKMFNLWGANAAPLDFPELFSALQTGVFDGQENPLQNVTSSKFYEVQKYLSMTGHVYTPTYLVASKGWYEALEPAAQQMLREIAVKNGDASRERGKKFDDDGIGIVKDKGVQVNDDVDKAAFAKAGQPLYDDYQKKYGALLDLYHKSIGR
jgi:tripartite ATP-independent transporter DctP family solute receptor